MTKPHLRLVDPDDIPATEIADSHQSLFVRAMTHSPVNMCIGVLGIDGRYHVFSDLESDLAEAGFVMKMYDASGSGLPEEDGA